MTLPRITMGDLEDVVLLLMRYNVDRGFAKDVLVDWLCRVNGLPSQHPNVVADVEGWATKINEKWAQLGRM